MQIDYNLLLDNILLDILDRDVLKFDFISSRTLLETQTYLELLDLNTNSDIDDFLKQELPSSFVVKRFLDLERVLSYLESQELYNLCFKLKTILSNI